MGRTKWDRSPRARGGRAPQGLLRGPAARTSVADLLDRPPLPEKRSWARSGRRLRVPWFQCVASRPLSSSGESSRAKRLYYRRVVLPAIRSAGCVLTGSQFSRNELIHWSGLPPEAVTAVGYGCSFPRATSAELDRSVETTSRAVLFVGNPKPHKNFSLLIAALGHLDNDVQVVTVGVPYNYVAEKFETSGVALSRVSVLEDISDSQLREVYLTASCVALPSTYEGFGLAALEGMAVGTPTAYICDAVHEVVGPLGFRSISPTDGEAYADVLSQAMAMDKTARDDLIARAMTFSWDDSATLVDRQIEAMRT